MPNQRSLIKRKLLSLGVYQLANKVIRSLYRIAPQFMQWVSRNSNLKINRNNIRERRQLDLLNFLETDERIHFGRKDAPRVYVLVVVHDQAALTLACLKSLATQENVHIDVIIYDNASSDKTEDLMKRLSGAVRIIRNNKNIGFLNAVNEVASNLNDQPILLLNNDAVIEPDAISAALETLNSDKKIGAVGGMIIAPDGYLQEAGCIIWSDGSCMQFGRGLPPEHPAVIQQRDVDYVSGAFLMIRQGLFDQLGGFDKQFQPAYYEETDLCFRLTQTGYRIVYEPKAKVYHLEFGSIQREEEAISLQAQNQRKFILKHASDLRNVQPEPTITNLQKFLAPSGVDEASYNTASEGSSKVS